MKTKGKAMAMRFATLAAGGLCVAGCTMMMSTALSADATPVAPRVAADFTGQEARPVWHYAVPPMSEIQRLPDVYPADGVANGTVRIVAARDEYEPGSFLVWARSDLGKVRFDLGAFRNEKGDVFPKEALDLKVVKVWYQNRNAWFSYFGDTGFKLCPELLLNDEDLIRVDTRKEANYARLVGKGGQKTEQWLNPPRQFDVRKFREPWRSGSVFHCMREDFRDAATLQPVALPKNEFRNFFLTAHVAKNAKPGLYRGEIAMTSVKEGRSLGAIPVEIRVLDFELPQPKCYGEPEKDFLVSSYSYISFGLILEQNGGDVALARRQLASVLKNQVAHNQTMHMVRGNMNNEAFETVAAMKEAGMRMDVFQGVVVPPKGDPEMMRARAQVIADEFDRRFGHHNVYMGYGDEPGARWLAEHRPLFEAYQSVGLKFFIAGHTVFTKAGYLYDWHNAADDATDPTLPRLWGKMHNASRIAWYANQHVGSENPAFCRRQNGLGAYLSGYTALCNYAHHFGPYNDDSTTYKPMVLAYGSYDGVIDTIAWEGFREGIDDIRYATLLTDLARKAEKSKDVKVRYLGAKAMQYLALTDPKACDQDSVRGEMIRFITALKPLVAPYAAKSDCAFDPAAAKPGAARAEASLQAAIAAELAKLPAARGANGTNGVHLAVAEAYRRFGRESEGGDHLVKVGLPGAALTRGYYDCLPEKRRAVLSAAYAQEKDLIWSLLPERPELLKTDFDAAVFGHLRPGATNDWKRAVSGLLAKLGRHHEYVWGEKPKAFAAVYEHVLPIARKWGVPVPSETAQNAVWAYVMLKNARGAIAAAKEGLQDGKAKPQTRYYLGLAAALANVRADAGAFERAAKVFDETVKDVAGKDRVAALCDYGAAVLNAGGEAQVRGLNDFRKSLYRPAPKKRYVVHYSERPVTGISDWDRVTAERQAYDRRYGGNMDFLVTDVTSGSRAVGDSKETLVDPTMQVVADVNGIHFLVRFADPKALDVKMGLVGNCSFEGYIAPGANTPYACFMYTPQSGSASVFNTTYPTFGARPMSARTPERKFRFTSDYAAGESRHYLFFSWENWMQRVPRDGSVWDFENMCWHRSGNSCWNGTESIHGRSTWGELEFRLTDAQRAQILKPLLVAAYRGYSDEKRTHADSDGALIHWADAAIGDPDFHEAKVKPLAEELDRHGKLLSTDMLDSTVFWLEEEALPRWQDIRFEVERRRAAWLLERN